MSDSGNYIGNADPADASGQNNALKFLVQAELAKLNTAALVKVVKAPYDASGNPIPPGTAGPVGFIDVQPLVNQLDGSGNATPHGVVYRLSYHRYQSGAGAIISDPAVGDIGKMVVANRDTSSVRATGAQANPGSRRKFNMADGTFFGCTIAGAPGQYIAFSASGVTVADKNGNVVTMGTAGITITVGAGHSVAIIGNFTATGSITAGFGTGDAITVQHHTHAQGNDSHGDGEVPTDPPTAGT